MSIADAYAEVSCLCILFINFHPNMLRFMVSDIFTNKGQLSGRKGLIVHTYNYSRKETPHCSCLSKIKLDNLIR